MKILVFGKYDAEYSRNAVLIEGLRRTGVQVIECRVSPIGVLWPLRLLAKYIMMRSQYDAMLVAFPGQEVMVLARLLTRRPIVFDAFTSHYEGYVEDRAIVTPSSLRARWLAFIDKVACTWSDAVLTDTSQHAQYLHKRYGIPLPRITAVFVGTLLQPVTIPERHAAEFIIHFHGSNVPLQGIDVIWRAMRRLWNERVRFQMIGPFVVPNELRALGEVDLRLRGPLERVARPDVHPQLAAPSRATKRSARGSSSSSGRSRQWRSQKPMTAREDFMSWRAVDGVGAPAGDRRT